MSTYRFRRDRLAEAAQAKGDATRYAIAQRTGLDESTLSRWYAGKSTPSTASLLRLASTYELGVEDLVEVMTDEPVKEPA